MNISLDTIRSLDTKKSYYVAESPAPSSLPFLRV